MARKTDDASRITAEFTATPRVGARDTFYLRFIDDPIPSRAYRRFAQVCENNIEFGIINGARLRELLREAHAEREINIFQADSIRRHIIRQYNISNAWRVDNEMDEIMREYDSGKSVIDLSVAHKLSPYSIFKGIMLAQCTTSREHDNESLRASARARALGILRDLSLGKIGAPSDVYNARDAAQYELARDYDFESAAVQMRMAAEADAREHNFIDILRNIGIRLSTQADLVKLAQESGEHPITPDVLFHSTVYVNGTRAYWLDFKSYCGSLVPFLVKSTSAQSRKYTLAFGNGFIVYEYGYVDSIPFKCASAFALREIIES